MRRSSAPPGAPPVRRPFLPSHSVSARLVRPRVLVGPSPRGARSAGAAGDTAVPVVGASSPAVPDRVALARVGGIVLAVAEAVVGRGGEAGGAAELMALADEMLSVASPSERDSAVAAGRDVVSGAVAPSAFDHSVIRMSVDVARADGVSSEDLPAAPVASLGPDAPVEPVLPASGASSVVAVGRESSVEADPVAVAESEPSGLASVPLAAEPATDDVVSVVAVDPDGSDEAAAVEAADVVEVPPSSAVDVSVVDLDALVERLRADPVATRVRVARLSVAFAEARRPDDGMRQVLPPLRPAVSWVARYMDKDPDSPTGLRERAGWVDRRADRFYTDIELKRLLVAGYKFQIEMADQYASSLDSVSGAWVGQERTPEIEAALAAVDRLVSRAKSVATMHDYWRSILIASPKVRLSDISVSAVSDRLDPDGPWVAHAEGRSGLPTGSSESRARAARSWAWAPDGSGDDEVPSAPERDARWLADVDGIAVRLLEPDGEFAISRLGLLAVRLQACRPGCPGFRSDLPPPADDRAFVVDGDPSPSRGRFYRMSESERAAVFGRCSSGPDADGSASDPSLLLPAGCVVVLPDGEGAYLRGRGWRICRDRSLLAWDWRGEPGPPLPVGGSIAATLGGRFDGLGRRNDSPVPIGGWLSYRGNRWWNLDGSGSLRDETDFEWEDRRDRMRATFWSALRATLPRDPVSDALSAFAPSLSPEAWRMYFWTMIGHYMVDDDWVMQPGEWRWARGVSPSRDAPLQSSIRFNVGVESWPSEWSDRIAHDRKWIGDFMPSALLDHPAVRDALSYPLDSSGPDAASEAPPLLESWFERLREAVADMDLPAAGDVPGSPTEHRVAFDQLVAHALDGKDLAAWWSDVERKLAFDARQRASWRAEVDAHRAWMRRRCRIAYVPDPEGVGPHDGPDARILVAPWSHDFMPEPLVAPAAFGMDWSPSVGHDYRLDPDQGNGIEGHPAFFLNMDHTIKGSLPKAEPAIRENETRRLADPVADSGVRPIAGVAGPDDPAARIVAEGRALGRDPAQLMRRARTLYGMAERLLFPQPPGGRP